MKKYNDMQHMLTYVRKAVDTFNMIDNGDKIAVALSGGKDSITMLMALKHLQLFYPKHFDIIAVSVNPGFEFFDLDLLHNICTELDIALYIEDSHSKEIVFDIRKEKNPCSLCANLRRGVLNSVAIREGCNKISLGHNEDDVLETFLMNLFYNGNISTLSPKSYMDRSKITLIRPLIFAPEKDIKKFIKKNNITVMRKACPMDGFTKREDIKNLIYNLGLENPMLRANLFGAIKRSNIQGWNLPNS